MIIARERYLDDTRQFHLTVKLETRTGAMHSLLSNVPSEQRDVIASILVRAMDEIAAELGPSLTQRATR
jgi:hypothetical protein